jgi:hypothetical protein
MEDKEMALKDAGGAAQDGETWYGADANEVAFLSVA